MDRPFLTARWESLVPSAFVALESEVSVYSPVTIGPT